MTRILTGITPTGTPHIGNYFGMMKQTIDLQSMDAERFFFISDQHTFTSKRDPEEFRHNVKTTVLDWLALGVNPDKSVFYRQSDVPAHTELTWYLSCLAPMGLLERAHAYKDKTAKGLEANIGLFTYPILMTADIILYDAEKIPVGKDQIQHVEIARDIAQKFNHHYGETFVLPEALINEDVMTIPGLDGAKMSKSYGNTIEIFADEKVIKKKIMSIKTDSVELGEPLNPETCNVMAFHRLFGNPNLKQLENQYRNGEIGFGESKKQLFALVWEYFAEARARREKLAADQGYVDQVLSSGAGKANEIAGTKLKLVRERMGMGI